VRLGAAASEAQLRRTPSDSFDVVHLATHAVVDEWAMARTAIALAPGGGEDGFLGPSDLATLRLRAPLVVLSACRTAGGVLIGGEGIRGLAAPLLESGSRAVVATQWTIGDRAALTLVSDFYRELAAGRTVGDALHQAKRAARRRGAPINEWAAFTALGDATLTLRLSAPASSPPAR
jgi:CHAT domain-containing protein